jgi:uncharacterized protein (TIGR02217 family)
VTLILPVLPGLAWENTKAPEFATKIQSSVALNEVRIGMTPYPVRKYAVVYNFLREYKPSGASKFEELNTLYNFFCNCGGSQTSFLYDDPEDDTIADVAPYMLFGTGDGSTTTFQLGRSLNGGFFEPVYNTHSTPKIYVSSVLQTLGVAYTISASGLVTFLGGHIPGAAAPIAWSGTYYWRCRFEDDSIEFNEFASLFWALKKLTFRTVLNA